MGEGAREAEEQIWERLFLLLKEAGGHPPQGVGVNCEQVQATESNLGRKHCISFGPYAAWSPEPPASCSENKQQNLQVRRSLGKPSQFLGEFMPPNQEKKNNNPEGSGGRVKKIFWSLWFLDSPHEEGLGGHFPGLRGDRGDQGTAGSSRVLRTVVTILWEEARGPRVWLWDLGPTLSPIWV